MKKSLIWVSLSFLIIILAGVYYFLQNNRHFRNNDAVKGIPVNAGIIINVSNIAEVSDLILKKIDYKDDLTAFSLTSKTIELAKKIDSLELFHSPVFNKIKKKQLYISFHLQGKSDIRTLLVTTADNKAEEHALIDWIENLKGKGYNVNVKQYDASDIYYIQKAGRKKTFYLTAFQGLIIGSYSEILVENSIRQINSGISLLSNSAFAKIFKTSNKNSPANLYINFSTVPGILKTIFKKEKKQPAVFNKKNALWAELDVDIKSKEIELNGFIAGERKSLINELFAGMRPQTPEISNILPSNTRLFMSYSLESSEEFHKRFSRYLKENELESKYRNKLNEIKQKYHVDIDKEMFSFTENEMGLVFTDINSKNPYSNSFLVVETRGRSFTLDKMFKILKAFKVSTLPLLTYRIDSDTSFPIYRGIPQGALEHIFHWFFPHVPQKYFALHDNYIIFSDNIKSLQEFLYANVLKKTLSNKKSFTAFRENFPVRENLFIYSEIPFFAKHLKNILKGEYVDFSRVQFEKLSRFYAGGIQITSTGDLLYTNIYANYRPSRENEPQTVWQSLLDSTVINKPVLVKNHYTNEKELMVQDAKFNLYLLNNSGRLLWKKPLDGKILGTVQQIDFYRNNKLQYIFNTKNKIYLLDRNGNSVDRYPINLPSKATNGLAIMDYEKNKDYRIFLATADKKVRLFDKKGNRITGWEFNKTEGIVTQPVQHFRSNSKDYIVFSDDHKIYILNRRGNTRVRTDKHITTSANSIFYIEGKNTSGCRLITTSPKAEIITIDIPTGKTKLLKVLPETAEFGFTHFSSNGSYRYVFILPNSFKIFDRSGKELVNKSFSNTMSLTIDKYQFASNNFKFGLLGNRNHHIYLLNSDGTTYKGFPLRGNSRFSIGFLKTSSSRFNLVVGGDNNYIYNYIVE